MTEQRDGYDWTVDDSADARDREYLSDRINEFNFSATGIYGGKELSIFLRGGQAHVDAGIYGWTWGGCLFIEFLWVREELRSRGLGKQLLISTERKAVEHGCRMALLNTHSFQASGFYRELGYEVYGEIEGYPRGRSYIHLRKDLR